MQVDRGKRRWRLHVRPALGAMALMLLALPIVAFALIAGCAPRVAPAGPWAGMSAGDAGIVPRLSEDSATMRDGTILPLRVWQAVGEPRAVILAVHGFNDYSRAFESPAAVWSADGLQVYAYDQRGFGQGANWGQWAGAGVLASDLRTMLVLLRARHPGLPLAVVGESMGAAVVLAAYAADAPLQADAIVLSAPAVWSRETMPAYQRATLWVAAHTVPWLRLTGRGLKIRASDNDEMLRSLGRDPLVVKGTRVDAIYGLVDLMDRAIAAAPRLETPTLVLFGREEQLIPPAARRAFFAALPQRGQWRVAVYDTGFHMLFRDLNADRPIGDVAAWLGDPAGPLPSGADATVRYAIAPDGAEPACGGGVQLVATAEAAPAGPTIAAGAAGC